MQSHKTAHIDCAPQAWLAAHLAMAVALQEMQAGLPHVASVHDAAHLMERIVLAGHERLQEVRVPLAPFLALASPTPLPVVAVASTTTVATALATN